MIFEYTHQVKQLFAEQGSMLVEFTPTHASLTKITYNVPITSELDINDISTYVAKFAPHDKWYAQYLILTASDRLLGTT
jgi:hypothetical protein